MQEANLSLADAYHTVFTTSGHRARRQNSARHSPTARRIERSRSSGRQKLYPRCLRPWCGFSRQAAPPREAMWPSTLFPRTEEAAFSRDTIAPGSPAALAQAAWNSPRPASVPKACDEGRQEPSAIPCRRQSRGIRPAEDKFATARSPAPEFRFGPACPRLMLAMNRFSWRISQSDSHRLRPSSQPLAGHGQGLRTPSSLGRDWPESQLSLNRHRTHASAPFSDLKEPCERVGRLVVFSACRYS